MKSHGEKHPYNHAKAPTSENLRHEAHRKKHEKPHDTPSTAAPPTVRKRASAQVPLPHRNIQPGIYRPLFLPPREATIKDAPLRTEKGQIQNQSSRRWTGRLQKIAGKTLPPVCRVNPFPPGHGRTRRLLRPEAIHRLPLRRSACGSFPFHHAIHHPDG